MQKHENVLVTSLKVVKNFKKPRSEKELQNRKDFQYRNQALKKNLPITNGCNLSPHKFTRRIIIQVRANNIFCCLRNLVNNKLKLVGSAGTYRVRISKKRLKYSAVRVFKMFLKKARPLLTTKGLIVVLRCPIRLRKKFLSLITALRVLKFEGKIFMRPLIVNIQGSKPFNGCRPPKKRRKKRKGLRVTC